MKRVAPSQEMATLRDNLLAHVTAAYAEDDRCAAAWLAGSFGRGVEDDWSDLDLHIYVHDAHLPAILAERQALYQRLGPPVLVQHDIRANAPQGGVFQLVMFPGGVELDLTIGPISNTRLPSHVRLLFDHVGVPPLVAEPLTSDAWQRRAEERLVFFWAMAPIAIKYAARGTTWKLVRMVDLLTDTYIDLWNLLNGAPESLLPVNLTNAPLASDLERDLPRLDATISVAAALKVVEAQCVAVAAWHPVFAARGAKAPESMPDIVNHLIGIARAE